MPIRLIPCLLAACLLPLTAFPRQNQLHATRAPSPRQIQNARREFQAGQRAERQADWTTAFGFYSLAARDWPANKAYRLRESLARFHLVQARVYTAEANAAAGHLRAARRELKDAVALDPSYAVARQRLVEVDQMLVHRPEFDRASPPRLPQLQPQPGKRNFDYRGDIEGAYQEIARQFGLAAAFDPLMPRATIRFRVDDVDFPTAMRLLAEMTRTYWRPLAPRLFFVTGDTPAQLAQYAPSIVRSVLLRASDSPSEMEETARVVRGIAEITQTQLDTATHTLTLRGTPKKVALAAALASEIERPRGELLLELDILEVNRNLAQQLGITPPTSATAYAISPSEIAQAEQSTAGLIDVITQIFGQPSAIAGVPASQVEALLSSGQLSAANLIPPLVAFGGGKTTFLATLPGALAQLGETLNLVQGGQQMFLRAEDGEPATLFVGDRYPVSLFRFSSGLSSPGFVPQVTNSSFPRSDFPVGSKPEAIAAGDFNGDGYSDLAVANEGDNTVSILLNNGSGSFTTGQVIDVPAGPVALVAGDFNGDGKTDLAVASSAANLVTILLGKGDGTFSIGSEIFVPSDPVALLAGDFNADGKADLAVASTTANTVSILLGQGDGSFQSPVAIPVGAAPVALAAGDYNGDGKTDLAVLDQGDDDVLVLTGQGDGAFTRGGAFPTGKMPTALASGHFTGNGFLDLAVANESDNSVSILLGNGDGTFQPRLDYPTGTSPVALLAADFTSNGFLDLAVANQADNNVSILLNDGTGNFSSRVDVSTGNSPDALASADFDKNGLPDLAIANFADNSVSVILNDVSLVPPSATAGLTPYPGFEYVDLGLKVTVTPRLHPDGSVTLNMKAQILGLTPVNVDQVPILTQRSIEQTARVKEGQPTILVSFLQPQENLTLTGWPGLAALGGRNKQSQDEELVILVRPRLVRTPPRTSKTFYAGVGP